MAGGMQRGRAAGPLAKGVLYYNTHLAYRAVELLPGNDQLRYRPACALHMVQLLRRLYRRDFVLWMAQSSTSRLASTFKRCQNCYQSGYFLKYCLT